MKEINQILETKEFLNKIINDNNIDLSDEVSEETLKTLDEKITISAEIYREKTDLKSKIEREIMTINEICEALERKILRSLDNPASAMFIPSADYANLKKIVKELLELKAKILLTEMNLFNEKNKNKENKDFSKILDTLNKLR